MSEGKTTKIVRFDVFCNGGELDGKVWPACVNKNTPETEKPCNRCLNVKANENSRKPVNYIPEKEFKHDNKRYV